MGSISERLGISKTLDGAGSGRFIKCTGPVIKSISPVNNTIMGTIRSAGKKEYEKVTETAFMAFKAWGLVPAPKRGDIVRQIGDAFRKHKKDLGELISMEVGKIRAEGEGEVQEMIDMADFATGQSRMLYGLSMHSERPDHRMYEQWHPLGPVGVISAFNFPMAVWAWNAMLALIAGNTVIWKPSSKAPMSAIAATKIAWDVLKRNDVPEGVLNLVIGNRQEIGENLLTDRRIPLISATGSVEMGRHVAKTVAERLGRSILELGGNNGVIVTPKADLETALRAILFGAVGTAGQRCTSTRRLVVHKNIAKKLTDALIKAYRKIRIGNPLDEQVLMGPLIDREAVNAMQNAINKIKEQKGRILYGGKVLSGGIYNTGTYVTPCICEIRHDAPVVMEETFAPLLYIMRYNTIEEAVKYHNAVPQGLSSSIFTNDIKEAEFFLSNRGSDCGIANVNIGTSGAEIGGAFGGEKDTGGGRESGSDAWKAYMRRQTCTVNWSGKLPLSQGITFG
ncbi:MAG: aldehyde dehydrogenase family protein, partial [Proteobacteria bacterium]|nr:aldehyde dehydrogenase family protein [Pseudomonadota bacterium]